MFLASEGGRKLEELLRAAAGAGASDIYLTVGSPAAMRVDGKIWRLKELADSGPERAQKSAAELLGARPEWANLLTPAAMEEIAAELLSRARHRAAFEARGTARFAVSVPGLSRFRVSVFRQRGSPAASVRVLGRGVPDLDRLFPGLPEVREALLSLALSGGGLVVVAGPAGSGKSSTVAAVVDAANRKRALHIVTVEDPIEYLHAHAASVVDQREVGEDVESVADGVAAAAADADLIAAGDVPDAAAAEAVLAGAEAGRLVLCAVRAGSLEEALFAVPDLAGSAGARSRFASVVRAVVFQKAVPAAGSGRTVAAGVCLPTRAVRLALRTGDREGAAAAARAVGSGCPLERSLARLAASGAVSLESAEEAAEDLELFWRFMRVF